MPLPPGCKPPSPEESYVPPKGLNHEEVLFICKSHLKPSQLTDPKMLAFICSYMENRNPAQAAREAGLKNGGYWRSRPEIHGAIEALTAKSVMKFGYDAEEVVERVKEIAGIDPVFLENPDGSYKTHLSQVPPEVRRAIKKFKVKNMWGEDANGMKVVVGQLIEVEMWDKLKSLELLGREKNILKETKKIEHDVTANMASVLLASKERAELRSREVMEITGRIDEGPLEMQASDSDKG